MISAVVQALILISLASDVAPLAVLPAQGLQDSTSVGILLPLPFSGAATGTTSTQSAIATGSAARPNSTFSLNISTNTYHGKPSCNADIYGNPQAFSCEDALRQIEDDDDLTEYADRTYPESQRVGIALPYRFGSGDGKCVIDIDHSATGMVDYATPTQLKDAASQLLNTCVWDEGNGGTVTGLGQRGALTLSIRSYTPRGACPPGPWSWTPSDVDCEALLSTMSTSTANQTFGLQGNPGVEVGLPLRLKGPTGKCVVDLMEAADMIPWQTSWYDVWQSMSSVYWMCLIHKGTPGYAVMGPGKTTAFMVAFQPPTETE